MSSWRSIPGNVVLADTSGNIAYMLVSSSMKKSNDMPYLGTSLLDGTSVKNDCQGLVSTTDLPFSMNPSKGYFVTANNRVMPERASLDIGATSIITARAIRINEMIAQGIQRG